MSRWTEWRSVQRFLKQLRYRTVAEPSVILDVGSRDCRTSVTLARKYPRARVFAFEAHPESFEKCRRKAAAYGNISVTFGAVHEFDGQTPFFPVIDGNVGASSVFRFDNHSGYPSQHQQTEITVPAIRLDTWAAHHGIDHFDLVWMDLQGAELLALRGMGRLLETVSSLYLEVEFKPLYHGQPVYTDVDRYLAAHGFECLEVRQQKPGWWGNAAYARAA